VHRDATRHTTASEGTVNLESLQMPYLKWLKVVAGRHMVRIAGSTHKIAHFINPLLIYLYLKFCHRHRYVRINKFSPNQF